MKESKIGIKLADGTFYPVLDEDEQKQKRLILTTVKDNQESVKIDLFSGESEKAAEDKYIASLVIENISPVAKGEPEIELDLGVNEEGNLMATASDLATGEKQSLSVSLESLEEGALYEIPDFELDEDYVPGPEDIDTDYEALATEIAEHRDKDYVEPARENKMLSLPLLLLFIAGGLLVIVLISFLLFSIFRGPNVPPLEAGESQEVEDAAASEDQEPEEGVSADPDDEAEQAVSDEAPEAEQETLEAPESEDSEEEVVLEEPEVPEEELEQEEETEQQPTAMVEEDDRIWYYIRYGDTLWDLSNSFYRTPWLYERIARANGIPDPDVIYAGDRIFIPQE
ncbi:MAG: Hsp70 family protein [Spirochaetia bacterium]